MSRPRKAEALNIPHRAVEEAIAIIHEHGLEGFSMAAVARRVGCSTPALYAHFRDRDDLLVEVQAKVYDQITQRKGFLYFEAGEEAIDRMRKGGHEFVDFAKSAPGLYRLLYAPNHVDVNASGSIPDDALKTMRQGVEAAQQVGSAPMIDPSQLSESLWCMLHGAIMLALDKQIEGSAESRWERAHRTVDTVIDLLQVGAGRDTGDRGDLGTGKKSA